MKTRRPFAQLTAEEAAALVRHDTLVGFSGFTPAGSAKAVPAALARRAAALNASGIPLRVRVLTGASASPAIDDAMVAAGAMAWRAPYQNSRRLRQAINTGQVDFVDMHLSHVPQALIEGFFGEVDLAVVEACDVTEDGHIGLTTSVGLTPTLLQMARRVVVEVNRRHPPRVASLSDIVVLPPPPARKPIAINHPLERIGRTYIAVKPSRIVGIVEHETPDDIAPFGPPTAASRR